MNTQKVQITLTPEEIRALSLKGKSLGYSATKYIKFLIMKEANSIMESIPTFNMSSELEEKSLTAMKEYKNGETIKIKNISEIDSL